MFFGIQMMLAAVQAACIVLRWGTLFVFIPVFGLVLALGFAVKNLVDRQ